MLLNNVAHRTPKSQIKTDTGSNTPYSHTDYVLYLAMCTRTRNGRDTCYVSDVQQIHSCTVVVLNIPVAYRHISGMQHTCTYRLWNDS